MTHPTGPTWRILLVTVGIVLFVYTVLRGLDEPPTYAFAHWLLSYEHGFIKRGLIGTLVEPLLEGKRPNELRVIVSMLSMATLTLTFTALLRAAWEILRHGERLETGGFVPPLLLAFVSSSAIVLAASSIGYFDHFLTLLSLAAIVLIRHGRMVLAGLLCVVALAIHEVFAFCGLPVVVFAMLLRATVEARGRGEVPSLQGVLRRVGPAMLPPVAAFAFLMLTQASIPAERIEAARADLVESGALSTARVDSGVRHLKEGFRENVAKQGKVGVRRLVDTKIGRMAWPTLLVLVVSAGALLVSSGNRVLLPTLLVVALAPQATHFFATDAMRFTNRSLLETFLALFAIVTIVRPAFAWPRISWALAALAVLALVANLVWRTPVMNERVDGGSLFSPK